MSIMLCWFHGAGDNLTPPEAPTGSASYLDRNLFRGPAGSDFIGGISTCVNPGVFALLLSLFGSSVPASAAVFTDTFSGADLIHVGQSVNATVTFTTLDTSTAIPGDNFPGFEVIGVTGTVNGSAIVAPVNGSSY
jgi:hypothetical protein